MNFLKTITAVGAVLATFAFYACSDDNDSNFISAPESHYSSGNNTSPTSNDATNISSSGEFSSSSETESSSSSESYTHLAWEFMNPDIDYIEFTDERDGQVYRAVVIGEQTWMAQNLSYNPYGNLVYYKCPREMSLDSSCGKYGIFYDIEDANKVCPSGWHLPSSDEWETLLKLAGGPYGANKTLRTTTGWPDGSQESEGNGNDDFGFSVYPAGYENYSGPANFGKNAEFWTSSYGRYPIIVDSYYTYFKTDQTTTASTTGHSIRCIKDSAETESNNK